jgi:ubiquinol-cytochrome c reductase cytochrome b subunit
LKARLRRIGGWIHDRAGLEPIFRFLKEYKVPPELGRTKKGWFWVFGQALVFVFLAQVVTGTGLAMKYIPSPVHAWDSLQFLNNEVVWGGFVRALHYFGASAMVVLVFAHMARIVITGSYKFPRELNWITGVVLLFLILAMAFTGQLLRWDHHGVATVDVAASILGRFPLVGGWLMEIVLSGQNVGGATLSRFFALHVVVFPLLILGLIGVHLYLAVRNGVSEPPRAGRPVDPATYRSWYERHKEEGNTRLFPDVAWKEVTFVLVVYAIIFGLAFFLGPKGPGAPPDPTFTEQVPRPDWYFLWLYTLIWYKPAALDAVVLVWFPLLVFPALMLLPLLFGTGERAPSRRPWAVAAVGGAFVIWATLTAFGLRPHWIPDFDTEPVPAALLAGAPPEVLDGAATFHERGCQYCHVAFDRGGDYGPDLNRSTARLSREEMTVRIMMGIGNMPAYGHILSAPEVDNLLAYIYWAAGRGAVQEGDRAPPGQSDAAEREAAGQAREAPP